MIHTLHFRTLAVVVLLASCLLAQVTADSTQNDSAGAAVHSWSFSLATYGYIVPHDQCDKAAQGLKLATVAASNDSDQNAVRLLTTDFNNVQKWSTALVESRKSLGTANYSMSPNALDDDPLYQTITRCSQFLGTMLAGGKFEDDGSSCH